ncbi:hypothetical protein BKA65DRAFT_589454 [Rhexocercosporidium sp. MPI-PUGE-AT-0058]|nr:hypothetical protein BKA65DRAFT_589454 [Rhexocercosporidium sp. MPI-PUGE-AT-0058]
MNAAQYSRPIDLEHENGVVLMEAMWTRYLPAAIFFKEELLPIIGPVKRVYADFSFLITWLSNGLDLGASSTNVIHASSMSVPGVSGDVDDINTIILSRQDNKSHQQNAVGIVTTSMTLPGSSKPPFYRRLQAKKAAPAELHVHWYDAEHLDEAGMEMDEVIKKPIERGRGIWYQADAIAKVVLESKATQKGRGEVLGAEESLRVLAWMDQARKQAGIVYPPELDAL